MLVLLWLQKLLQYAWLLAVAGAIMYCLHLSCYWTRCNSSWLRLPMQAVCIISTSNAAASHAGWCQSMMCTPVSPAFCSHCCSFFLLLLFLQRRRPLSSKAGFPVVVGLACCCCCLTKLLQLLPVVSLGGLSVELLPMTRQRCCCWCLLVLLNN